MKYIELVWRDPIEFYWHKILKFRMRLSSSIIRRMFGIVGIGAENCIYLKTVIVFESIGAEYLNVD